MQPTAGRPSYVYPQQHVSLLVEIDEDKSIEQTNSELKEVEAELLELSEVQKDLHLTFKKDGEKLTETEKKTQEASKAIVQGTSRLSESQATKSTMERFWICLVTGTIIGGVAGAAVFLIAPPVAGIVAVFVGAGVGMSTGGGLTILK
jgi:hypothetical protein